MRSRRTKHHIEESNSKRQAQALSILTIGTAIIGVTLFQADLSLDNLFSTDQLATRFQIAFALFAAASYIGIAVGTKEILSQTTLISGRDMTSKLIDPLLTEIVSATAIFITKALFTTP